MEYRVGWRVRALEWASGLASIAIAAPLFTSK
jgi:hypothetical protein